MEYQRNEKYFKASNTHLYIGIAALAVGVLAYVLQRMFWLWYPLETIGILLGVAGAAVAFLPGMSKSGDKDIEEQIAKETEGFLEEQIEKYHLKGKLSSNLEPTVINSYDYSEAACIKKGLDGQYRASKYVSTVLIFTTSGVVTVKKSFSLIKENIAETVEEYLYPHIDRAFVEDTPVTVGKGDKAQMVKHAHFCLNVDGQTVLRIPTAPNATVEGLANDLNAIVARVKEKG
ncbi:MAG: hypothetical protein KBS76_02605 [Ruminococcus sp.]|nr:hypothetical protein [Candidatus Apopatosoma intestinale]